MRSSGGAAAVEESEELRLLLLELVHVLVKRCGLSFEELCRYKYLLNVGSNGYANKLKYLFLTGSVVIWVKKDSLNYEFFEHQFVPGVHYVSVETVEEVPDMIRRLQADPAYARAIAKACLAHALKHHRAVSRMRACAP